MNILSKECHAHQPFSYEMTFVALGFMFGVVSPKMQYSSAANVSRCNISLSSCWYNVAGMYAAVRIKKQVKAIVLIVTATQITRSINIVFLAIIIISPLQTENNLPNLKLALNPL